jgi:hypothetical protein
MPQYPQDKLLGSEEAAKGYVKEHVVEEADCIKVIADLPGSEQSTINTLVVCIRNTIISGNMTDSLVERAHVPLDKTLGIGP